MLLGIIADFLELVSALLFLSFPFLVYSTSIVISSYDFALIYVSFNIVKLNVLFIKLHELIYFCKM